MHWLEDIISHAKPSKFETLLISQANIVAIVHQKLALLLCIDGAHQILSYCVLGFLLRYRGKLIEKNEVYLSCKKVCFSEHSNT